MDGSGEGVGVRMLYLLSGLALAVVLYGCQAGAAGGVQGESNQALTESVSYFDGTRWREVWVNGREVVEFVQPNQTRAAHMAIPAATLLVELPGVRIWRLHSGADESTAVSRALAPTRVLSPVFHLTSVGGSRLALSGNIVVRFQPEWSAAQVQAWIAKQKLVQVSVLNGAAATHVLHVGSGLEALARANAIQQGGEVVNAMPEWWREAGRR